MIKLLLHFWRSIRLLIFKRINEAFYLTRTQQPILKKRDWFWGGVVEQCMNKKEGVLLISNSPLLAS